MEKSNKKSIKEVLRKFLRSPLMIPVASLLILVIFNLIAKPSFFELEVRENADGIMVITGNLISVIDHASELVILAIGMTLVTAASGGQDISVGAIIAMTASAVFRVVTGTDAAAKGSLDGSMFVAFLLAILVGALCGTFNGTLVSYFKIQPMIATLILFTAGRSFAAWFNLNRPPIVSEVPSFFYWGCYLPIKGIPMLPTPIFIAIICMIVIALVLKFTTLGLYTQSVGINEKSARLNGINPTLIKLLTFIILGVGAGICGFVSASRIGTIDYGGIKKDIEMDAILAVALGGNALSGGKFNMKGSIIAAYVIQFLTTTLLSFQVPATAISAYKAVVVIILVVLSAPVVREKISAVAKKTKKNGEKKEAKAV